MKKKKNELNLNKELETLFQFALPTQLKKSLYEVYAFYLHNLDVTLMNPDFNEIAMDFYFLHKFLEEVEGRES